MREIHTSERSAFKRCPQRWYWQYVEGWQPKSGDTPDALWFGIGIHEALAKWYKKGLKRGPHPADTWIDWADGELRYIRTLFDELDEPEWIDAIELGEAMLVGYVEKYQMDDNLDIMFIEHPFKVRIHDPEGKPVAMFGSTFDGVARDLTDGEVYLLEHKTRTAIKTAGLAHDDQAGAYCAVATDILRQRGILGPKDEINGILYNFLRKALPDDRPKNELGEALNQNGTVSARQQAPLFRREVIERSPRENRTQLLRIADEAKMMQLIQEGTVPLLKNKMEDCAYCPFTDVCLLHDRGGDAWKRMAKAEFKVGDPYERGTAKSASE